MSTKQKHVLFRYTNQTNGRFYYYDSITGKTTYAPTGDIPVYDPDTKSRIPVESLSASAKTARRFQSCYALPPVKPTLSFDMRSIAPEVPKSLETPSFMPSTLEADALTNTYVQFAHQQFRPQFVGSFKRAQIPIDSLISYGQNPIRSPLLKSVNKDGYKAAPLMFKTIMKYTDVHPSKKVQGTLTEFVGYLFANSNLIDEAYAQLIKQTTNAPNPLLLKALEMFLILASWFVPSEQMEPHARSHLAKLAQTKNKLAILCYIRLVARIGCHRNQPEIEVSFLKTIPQQAQNCTFQFGVSLYEIMMRQTITHPRLPIPLILHQMAELLFSHNCDQTEGIFRLPGSNTRIAQMIEDANEGKPFDDEYKINDLGSVFKQWFRDLPGGLLNREQTEILMTTKGADNFIEFANTLEPLQKFVLMYLVGFLKRLSINHEITKMNVQNLAMVFGPNILFVASEEPQFINSLASTGQNFLTALIKNAWNITAVYPLDIDML